MNTKRFIDNLNHIQNTLLNSDILKHLKSSNYSYEALSNALLQVAQISVQTALNLEEIELKERETALVEEKTRQELELAMLNAKAQAKLSQSEAIKSLIQAQSMIESIPQNASINKANAYVGFLNVVGNATDKGAISSHASNAIRVINNISTGFSGDYNGLMGKLKSNIDSLLNQGGGSKEVFIHAPKMLLYAGEEIRLMGFSAYANNTARFVIGNKVVNSKNLIFKAQEPGEVLIRFEVVVNNGTISDEITLKVIDKEIENKNV